jgi:hypothetical protein
VVAVHDRRLLGLQRLGGRDVGGNHIVLDQLVCVEPLARSDREDAAFLVQHDAALGKVEVERRALFAGAVERGPTFPEGLQRLFHELGRNRRSVRFHFGHGAG